MYTLIVSVITRVCKCCALGSLSFRGKKDVRSTPTAPVLELQRQRTGWTLGVTAMSLSVWRMSDHMHSTEDCFVSPVV